MGLDVVDVVEVEPPDRNILEIFVPRGGRADSAQLLTELVVLGVIGERDVGEKTAGLVLQFPEHRQVFDPVLGGLDVTVEHGAVGSDA